MDNQTEESSVFSTQAITPKFFSFTTSSTSETSSTQSQLPFLYTYVALMVLMSIIGIVGNIMVIAAILTSKKLRVLHNAFIANLAVADLLVTSLVNPFAIVGALDMGALFYRLPAFCEFLATICVTSFVCSIWNISSVSLNRYFYICHRAMYAKIYNRYTVPAMVLGIWCFAFLVDLPNFLGWGDHIFDTRNYLCNYNYSHDFTYTRGFITTLGFILPVSIICYSYFRIYLVARKSEQRIRKHNTNPVTNQRQRNIKSADKRLLKTVAIICTMFVVMWTPYAISAIFDLGDYFWWFLVASFMAFTNSSVNFLIYATDKNFRQAYSEIRNRMHCFKVCSVKRQTTSSKANGNPDVKGGVEMNDSSSNSSAKVNTPDTSKTDK